MVATLLSLKLRLTLAELKRSTARLVVWIIMALYLAAMVGLVLIGLAFASLVVTGHEAMAGALTILIGAVVVVGWTVLPLLFFGSDQTLDPARFIPFPLTGRQLAPGLLVAGVVGLPGLATAILALGSALLWLHHPAALVAGLVGGVLGWLMAQVGCRLASAGLSGLLSTRKARDLTGLIGLIVILLLSTLGYGVSLVMSYFSADPGRWSQVIDGAGTIGAVLAWTPLGAPWALAGDIGQGAIGLAVVHLLLTLVYLGLGLWAYAALLGKALVTPVHISASAPLAKGDAIAQAAGWAWAQGSLVPVAVIARRCLRYWRRDPRYLGQVPAAIFMPVLFTIMGLTMGRLPSTDGQVMPSILTTGMEAFGLGFMALLCGYALSSDIASDATAWWIHLATGVKGWQDRLGRIIAQAIWALPLIVVVAVAVTWVVGHPGRIAGAVGASLCFYLVALGVSSVASALIIYPVALPGESPLRLRTAAAGPQMLSQFGCLAASGLLGLPVGLWAMLTHGAQDGFILLVGVVWGAAVLMAGTIWGGQVMDARAPAILQSLRQNDSRERG